MTPGRSLERGLLVVRGTLAFAALWMVGTSAAEIVGPPGVVVPELPRPAKADAKSRELARYDVIVRRNLFGGPATLLSPAAVTSAAAATSLPLRLLGTIVANPASLSLAVIGDDASNESVVVGTGDHIGDAQVERIEREAVLVSRAGRLERIVFEEAKSQARGPAARTLAKTARAAARTPRAAAPAAAPPTASPAARPAPVRAARGRGRDLDASETDSSPASADEADETLRSLASQARFLPEFGAAGEVRGIAVQNLVPGSQLERLGLRNGDLVVSVAGQRVDDPSSAQVLRGMSLQQAFAVEIVRAGAPTTLQVPAGALRR